MKKSGHQFNKEINFKLLGECRSLSKPALTKPLVGREQMFQLCFLSLKIIGPYMALSFKREQICHLLNMTRNSVGPILFTLPHKAWFLDPVIREQAIHILLFQPVGPSFKTDGNCQHRQLISWSSQQKQMVLTHINMQIFFFY